MQPVSAVADAEMLTYLTDASLPVPGLSEPRVGDSVELRLLRGGREVEAWSTTGIRLGRLPPAEREALDGLLQGGALPLQGRISAVVPRPLLLGSGRIHIRVTPPAN
ncbi:hypothetical protein QWZ14_28555 [Paeniroseomonas aquatica]|uniref:Uncharacterized protein n=1 Tax=Paeniroseomonas aquatica TaxID=373043 RepID=A0ABT8AG65_9PROT|nr:hypothetical protein [Paeniroseomonas aquatica]MDN3568349.1 hypothetical protein [Paeniroseomonas aquatica]